MIASCARPEHSCASAPPPASARWPCSGSSPTTRAPRSARCSSARFALAAVAVLGARARGRRGDRRPAGSARRDLAHRARRSARSATPRRRAASSPRWSGSTPRCCRCSCTRSLRWSPSRPSCSGASAPTRAASRRSRSRPAGWCSCSRTRKAGTLDPVGAALALGAAVVYTTYILTSQGVAGRLSPARAVRARLHRRRRARSRSGSAAGRATSHPAAVTRDRLGLAARHRGGVDGRRREPVLRRPQAGGPDERARSSRPSSRS